MAFFTKEIIKQYPYIPIEDEHRLNNFKIREHFYHEYLYYQILD